MIRYSNGVFQISVRQLVEFIFKSGDLDNRHGTKREQAMMEGTKIHKKLQNMMGASYVPEVTLKVSVPVYEEGDTEEEGEPRYVINIEGRADGIYGIEGETAIGIDEIKGMYADVMKFSEPAYVHKAQAMCYGYIKSYESECDVYVQVRYVNFDTEQVNVFTEKFTHKELADWFDNLIKEYIKWCDFYLAHKITFIETALKCEFPFPYREGQRKLVVTAYKTLLQDKRLFIQASTGIGKTIATIFPAVRAMGEEKAERTFYLTAKTITRDVAKSAVEILQGQGLKASFLIITAKEKMCLLKGSVRKNANGDAENEDENDFSEVIGEMECNPDACPYAKGHMDRVNDAVYELITTKTQICREDILEAAKRHMVCPFELSLDVAYYVDIIICDYNYVFDPNVRLQRFFAAGEKSNAFFLIDEAHNLIDRAREMYSVTLIKEDFIKARKAVREISRATANRINACNKALLALKRECEGFHAYNSFSEYRELVKCMEDLNREFSKFSERFPGFYDKDFSELFFAVRDFNNCLEFLDRGYVVYSRIDDEGRFIFKLYCTDPSEHIRSCLDMGVGSILFSATMLPITYYKKLLGGDEEDYAIYAKSPFDVNKRLLLIGKDVSTKYTRRTDDEYRKIGDYIRKVTSVHSGNYMVFFPSYAFLNRMVDELWDMDECLAVQNSHMNEAEREEFLKGFEENALTGKTRIGMCVMGGVFSEGIDLKGDCLIGVIVVGTGLPQINDEMNLLRRYFDESGSDGFSYAYMYPGMNKVLQSAGRLIRTDEDEGVILLLDDRFLRRDYQALFPREWEGFKVVDVGSVGEEVSEFWEK